MAHCVDGLHSFVHYHPRRSAVLHPLPEIKQDPCRGNRSCEPRVEVVLLEIIRLVLRTESACALFADLCVPPPPPWILRQRLAPGLQFSAGLYPIPQPPPPAAGFPPWTTHYSPAGGLPWLAEGLTAPLHAMCPSSSRATMYFSPAGHDGIAEPYDRLIITPAVSDSQVRLTTLHRLTLGPRCPKAGSLPRSPETVLSL